MVTSTIRRWIRTGSSSIPFRWLGSLEYQEIWQHNSQRCSDSQKDERYLCNLKIRSPMCMSWISQRLKSSILKWLRNWICWTKLIWNNKFKSYYAIKWQTMKTFGSSSIQLLVTSPKILFSATRTEARRPTSFSGGRRSKFGKTIRLVSGWFIDFSKTSNAIKILYNFASLQQPCLNMNLEYTNTYPNILAIKPTTNMRCMAPICLRSCSRTKGSS